MSTVDRFVVLEISRIEITHLAGLVTQFSDLLMESAGEDVRTGDPAVARLVPDAYRDDADAAREFRSVTEDDLLSRRTADARIVLDTLGEQPEPFELDDPGLTEVVTITLDPHEARAWMRTLAAVRLVLATRLGIVDDDDHEHEDPRFGIYDWVGYRLDGLVRAVSGDE
ncbi:DUF2017 family protein [Microbacterium sp. CJ88]|uniref:DUF2017 family protein n=1 Tax=Microbacterium sp. CJ88 TaxID=3445672 RepID=UPI003F65573A